MGRGFVRLRPGIGGHRLSCRVRSEESSARKPTKRRRRGRRSPIRGCGLRRSVSRPIRLRRRRSGGATGRSCAAEFGRPTRRRRRSGLPARCRHCRSTTLRRRRHSERRSRQGAPPTGARIRSSDSRSNSIVAVASDIACPFIDKLGCCEAEPVGTWNRSASPWRLAHLRLAQSAPSDRALDPTRFSRKRSCRQAASRWGAERRPGLVRTRAVGYPQRAGPRRWRPP